VDQEASRNVEMLTVVTILLGCGLLATELPFGDVEIGGFPIAYYLVASLLFIGFEMRKRLKT
jgi:hypothetical protein